MKNNPSYLCKIKYKKSWHATPKTMTSSIKHTSTLFILIFEKKSDSYLIPFFGFPKRIFYRK